MGYTLTIQTLWTQNKDLGVGEGIRVINIVSWTGLSLNPDVLLLKQI